MTGRGRRWLVVAVGICAAAALIGLILSGGILELEWVLIQVVLYVVAAVTVSDKIVTRELPAVDMTVAVANIAVPALILGGAWHP